MGKRGPPASKGATTTMRLEPALRRRLEAAAERANRSLSEELRVRLELSLDEQERRFGDPETYALCQLISVAFRDIKHHSDGKAWFEHPWSYGQAKTALSELFSYFQPPDIIRDAPPEAAVPYPLSEGFGPNGRKSLRTSNLGRGIAQMAVFRLEASLQHEDFPDRDRLRMIAAALLPRLLAAGMAGEAGRALGRIEEEST